MRTQHATVASKLLAIGLALLLLALGSIGLTLWVSWQLEGGAAAVNEAGRMRMLTYRLAHDGSPSRALESLHALDGSIEQLRVGDPSRPLFVPKDADTRARLDAVEHRWKELRPAWAEADGPAPTAADRDEF